jgi:lysophospholipase L1-like esterase
MWVVCLEGRRIIARPFSILEGWGEATVVAVDEIVSCPAVSLDPRGNPAVAWVNKRGEVKVSGFAGGLWNAPCTVSGATFVHRGAPSLAVGLSGEALVAWAEAAQGNFEDIVCSRYENGRWSAGYSPHGYNDVPDILPHARYSVEDGFSLCWSRLDGDAYSDRCIGSWSGGEACVPGEYAARLRESGLPPETAVVWMDGDGFSRTFSLRDVLERPVSPRRADTLGRKRSPHRGAESKVIIAFGDSITYGRGSSSDGPRTAYPVYLQALFNYNYPGTPFKLINEGVPGERTDSGLNRLDEVLDGYAADAILIMQGTNDIYYGISFETIQENLKLMAFKAARRGVFPILATIIPTDPAVRPEQYEHTKAFYTHRYIQVLGDRYGIPIADQWQAFTEFDNFGSLLMNPSPGNHPNDNGYRYAMTPRWYETIAPLLNLSFAPTEVGVTVTVENDAVARGEEQEFVCGFVPSNDLVKNAVDCYIGLLGPGGALYFFDHSFNVIPAATAAFERVLVQRLAHEGVHATFVVPADFPAGTYQVGVVTVRSLRPVGRRVNWTSELVRSSFEVTE